jgi:hypothetical protein
MLGCSAAVTETLSPSQLRPAVIQRMWTSETAGALVMLLTFSAMKLSFSLKTHEDGTLRPEISAKPTKMDA